MENILVVFCFVFYFPNCGKHKCELDARCYHWSVSTCLIGFEFGGRCLGCLTKMLTRVLGDMILKYSMDF